MPEFGFAHLLAGCHLDRARGDVMDEPQDLVDARVPGRIRFLAGEHDVVPRPYPRVDEVVGVDVRSGGAEQVAVPDRERARGIGLGREHGW